MHNTIGETAGKVWEFLDENGESSVTAITGSVDVPSTKVYMAVGWLAKEGKLEFHEQSRGKTVTLS